METVSLFKLVLCPKNKHSLIIGRNVSLIKRYLNTCLNSHWSIISLIQTYTIGKHAFRLKTHSRVRANSLSYISSRNTYRFSYILPAYIISRNRINWSIITIRSIIMHINLWLQEKGIAFSIRLHSIRIRNAHSLYLHYKLRNGVGNQLNYSTTRAW